MINQVMKPLRMFVCDLSSGENKRKVPPQTNTHSKTFKAHARKMRLQATQQKTIKQVLFLHYTFNHVKQ